LAFDGCSTLTSVSLPAATTIGNSAFSYCTSLTSVSLPAATSIGDSAFYDCSNLASVSLPAVISIGDYAFSDCTSLSTLTLGASPPILGSDVFYSANSAFTIRRPNASAADFAAWKTANEMVFGGITITFEDI
jgi:hypothetical protein